MKLKLICILITVVVVFIGMSSFISAKNEAASSAYNIVTLGRNMSDKDRIVRLETPERSYTIFVAGNGGVVVLK